MKRAVLSTIICFAFGDTWCDRVIAAQEEAKRLCTN